MDWHPIQGGVEIFLVASCHGNRDKLRPDGPLGSYADFTYLCFIERSSDTRRFYLRWRVTSQPVTQSTRHLARWNFSSLCWETLTPRNKLSPFTATTTNWSKCSECFTVSRGLLPNKKLMGTCAAGWDCIFNRVTRKLSHIFGILGLRKFWQVGTWKWPDSRWKSCYLSILTSVSLHFRMNKLKGFIR